MSDSFVVVNPCTKRTWGALPGDDRRRFCDGCNTYVHSLDQYTVKERTELGQGSDDRVCGRVAAEPVILRPSRRRVLLGALLALASPNFAEDGRVRIVVKDSDGFPLPGATVSLLDSHGKAVATQASDSFGVVGWTHLQPGSHRFSVVLPGFTTVVVATLAGMTGEPVLAVLRVEPMGEIVTISKRKRRWWWPFGR